jgi:hypothetical protein
MILAGQRKCIKCCKLVLPIESFITSTAALSRSRDRCFGNIAKSLSLSSFTSYYKTACEDHYSYLLISGFGKVTILLNGRANRLSPLTDCRASGELLVAPERLLIHWELTPSKGLHWISEALGA